MARGGDKGGIGWGCSIHRIMFASEISLTLKQSKSVVKVHRKGGFGKAGDTVN